MEKNNITVILIRGKSGSGKSTFATLVEDCINSCVKPESAIIIHNAEQVKCIARDSFNWNDKKDFTGRQLLIDITHTGYAYDKNLWEEKTLQTFQSTKEVCYPNLEYLIIPDWRYKVSYEYFKNITDKVITVDVVNPLRTKGTHDTHSSETDLNGFEVDMTIHNYFIPHNPPYSSLINSAERFVKQWIQLL